MLTFKEIPWADVRAQLVALKPVLEVHGLVVPKRDSLPQRWVARYPIIRDGRRIEGALPLGRDMRTVDRARCLLARWQEHFRRCHGGLPCAANTDRLLTQEVPRRAGMSGRTREAYRRRLRTVRSDPLALLHALVTFNEGEST
jgi:hypothetical protein